MAREFKETAHLHTRKEAFDEGWDRIFGNKEKVELAPDEKIEAMKKAKKGTKHATAGLCGEFGMSTFDNKAFEENYDNIQWSKNESETSKTSTST